jgi:hypothetical protein
MRWSIEKTVPAIGDTVLLNKSATPVFRIPQTAHRSGHNRNACRILVTRVPSSLGISSFVIFPLWNLPTASVPALHTHQPSSPPRFHRDPAIHTIPTNFLLP